MGTDPVLEFVTETWDASIIPALERYIRIPNKSPAFDPEWREHGYMAEAVELVAGWCKARAIAGLQVEVVQLSDRTPLIFMEIPACAGGDEPAADGGRADADTVLLYGHLDKQPEFTGWLADLGPWQPVLRDDRLYGRGGADDGYSAFAALCAIEALQRRRLPHARCVVVIEACEESGSYDLPAYVEHLRERIGAVSCVVCLDSGCGDYERLWSTTSLRGLVSGTLRVEVLSEGVHSGDASGVVPSSFRIARGLISRIEDERTGAIKLKSLHVKLPRDRELQAAVTARVLGPRLLSSYPWLPSVKPMQRDRSAIVLARTWQPTLSVVGAEGLPRLVDAGNVVRPFTSLKLSLRVPPTCDAAAASEHVKRVLEQDPPYGARVSFELEKAGQGWNAPALAPWLEAALRSASRAAFGRDAAFMGEGGAIPFMAMLGRMYPTAQFLITGLLGPQSNAHGPNEFLHIPTAKRLTLSVAHVLAAHAARPSEPRAAAPARRGGARARGTSRRQRSPARPTRGQPARARRARAGRA